MVKIEIGDLGAVIEDYKWISEDKDLENLLNTMLDPLGPSGADPYPDLTAAQEVIELLGGKIVEYDEPTDYPDGTVF